MRQVARSQWALLVGVVAGVGFLAAGFATGDSTDPMGIDPSAGALALVALAVGQALQLLADRRASSRRETDLLQTATRLREASEELDRLARTDALTGIANRRALFDLLGVEFRRSRRYGRELSVLMLDIDHFKEVNDRAGHLFGDEVLREVARVILRNLRESDFLGRYGGEEFAVVLPEAAASHAVLVGEKLRQAVAAHEFQWPAAAVNGDRRLHITVSVGVASTPVDDQQDEAELLSRADQALYEAKRLGRNRVNLYQKAPDVPAASAALTGGSALPPRRGQPEP